MKYLVGHFKVVEAPDRSYAERLYVESAEPRLTVTEIFAGDTIEALLIRRVERVS